MNPFSWLNRKRAGYWARMICWWRRGKQRTEVVQALKKHRHSISEAFVARLEDDNEGKAILRMSEMPRPQWTVSPYVPPMKNIKCTDGRTLEEHVLAMDDQVSAMWQGFDNKNPMGMTGLGFPGFPYLNELTQITEYRDISERTAKEMCRKWIKWRSTGDKKHEDQIKDIEAEFIKLHVKQIF